MVVRGVKDNQSDIKLCYEWDKRKLKFDKSYASFTNMHIFGAAGVPEIANQTASRVLMNFGESKKS